VEVIQHGRRQGRGCGTPVGQHGIVIAFFRQGSHADPGFFWQQGSWGGGEQRTGHLVGRGIGHLTGQGIGHLAGRVPQGTGQEIGQGTGQGAGHETGHGTEHVIGTVIIGPKHHTRALITRTATVRPSWQLVIGTVISQLSSEALSSQSAAHAPPALEAGR